MLVFVMARLAPSSVNFCLQFTVTQLTLKLSPFTQTGPADRTPARPLHSASPPGPCQHQLPAVQFFFIWCPKFRHAATAAIVWHAHRFFGGPNVAATSFSFHFSKKFDAMNIFKYRLHNTRCSAQKRCEPKALCARNEMQRKQKLRRVTLLNLYKSMRGYIKLKRGILVFHFNVRKKINKINRNWISLRDLSTPAKEIQVYIYINKRKYSFLECLTINQFVSQKN